MRHLEIKTLNKVYLIIAVIGLNDIGRISLRVTKPLFIDSYRRNRNTGSIILIDEATNETVAAGMII